MSRRRPSPGPLSSRPIGPILAAARSEAELARHGYVGVEHLLISLTLPEAPETPRMLAEHGLTASAHASDIREPDAVNALFDTVWAAHGRLDSLVNSAGGQFPQAAIDFSVKGWNAVINTNLNGTWYMMQSAAQRWRDRKHPGSIVNIVVVTTHGLYGIAHSIAARSGVIW